MLSAWHDEEGTDREILTLVWVARMLERACADLTLPQYRLLALIVSGEERASGLAGQLALARPTVSAAVETLVANGLLERTASTATAARSGSRSLPTGAPRCGVAERAMRERLDAFLADVPDPTVVTTRSRSSPAHSRRRTTARARRARPRISRCRGRRPTMKATSEPGWLRKLWPFLVRHKKAC